MAWIFKQVSVSTAPTKHLIIRSQDTISSKQTNHYSHAAFPNESSDDNIVLLREHVSGGVSTFAAILDFVAAKTWTVQPGSITTSGFMQWDGSISV